MKFDKNKDLILENYNIFKAWVIEKVLLPKWKNQHKSDFLKDDEVEVVLKFLQNKHFYNELKARLSSIRGFQNTKVTKELKSYNYTLYTDNEHGEAKPKFKCKNFDFSENLLNWKALDSDRIFKNMNKNDSIKKHKKIKHNRTRIKNIRVTGNYENKNNVSQSESRTETINNGLSVIKGSNSSISRASSNHSRYSLKAQQESLVTTVGKFKRHSFFGMSF